MKIIFFNIITSVLRPIAAARRSALAAFVIGASTTVLSAATFSDDNWASMNPSIPGADGPVYAAVVDDAGNLYIGGGFTVVGDVVAHYIAKWDGTNWSALGSGMNQMVSALAMSGGNLYAAGSFTNAGGIPANHIAKWDGSSWSPLGSGINGYPYDLAVSGGDLYAAGYFTNAGGIPANHIAKWDGSGWSALGLGIPYGYVYALAVSGSDLYVGGSFRTAGGNPATNIARWDGFSWSAVGSGISAPDDEYSYGGSVTALAMSGHDLYAGGYFTTAGGSAANSIAKWNGNNWSPLGSGMGGGDGYPSVSALVVSGGDLYAGGDFTTAGGSAANSIAKWNGSNWIPLGSGMN